MIHYNIPSDGASEVLTKSGPPALNIFADLSDFETSMKKWIISSIIFVLCLPASADWMEQLTREVRKRGIPIRDKGDLIQFLEVDDFVEDPMHSEANSDREYPELESYANDIAHIVKSEDGKKVQINFYYNANFYKSGEVTKREPASVITSSETPAKRPDNIEFRSQFFYSQLQATDSQNGGRSTTSSKLNMGLNGIYKRPINESMKISVNFGGAFMSFQEPESSSLEGESSVYFNLTGGLDWQLDEYFTAKGYMGLRQLPYLTAFGSQIAIDVASHPIFGAALAVRLEKLLGIDLQPEFVTEFLNNSGEWDVNAITGVRLGTRLNYFFLKGKSYKPMLSTWFNTYSQKTNNTDQSMTELGFWVGFQLDL